MKQEMKHWHAVYCGKCSGLMRKCSETKNKNGELIQVIECPRCGTTVLLS